MKIRISLKYFVNDFGLTRLSEVVFNWLFYQNTHPARLITEVCLIQNNSQPVILSLENILKTCLQQNSDLYKAQRFYTLNLILLDLPQFLVFVTVSYFLDMFFQYALLALASHCQQNKIFKKLCAWVLQNNVPWITVTKVLFPVTPRMNFSGIQLEYIFVDMQGSFSSWKYFLGFLFVKLLENTTFKTTWSKL